MANCQITSELLHIMRTTYASKSVHQDGTSRTKRYWYYTTSTSGSEDRSIVERLPANEIDRLVLTSLRDHLSNSRWLADQMKDEGNKASLVASLLRAVKDVRLDADPAEDATSDQFYHKVLRRIDAKKDRLQVSVNLAVMLDRGSLDDPMPATFEIPFQKRQNGRAKPIVIGAKDAARPDPDLTALIADARRWVRELLEGKATSVKQITEREGLRSGSVSRVLPLAWLAPDISTAILEGLQPPHLTAKSLREFPDLPLDWEEQRQVLGFPHT